MDFSLKTSEQYCIRWGIRLGRCRWFEISIWLLFHEQTKRYYQETFKILTINTKNVVFWKYINKKLVFSIFRQRLSTLDLGFCPSTLDNYPNSHQGLEDEFVQVKSVKDTCPWQQRTPDSIISFITENDCDIILQNYVVIDTASK
jgi:hypothetical protein